MMKTITTVIPIKSLIVLLMLYILHMLQEVTVTKFKLITEKVVIFYNYGLIEDNLFHILFLTCVCYITSYH